jgi:hypothetical protein
MKILAFLKTLFCIRHEYKLYKNFSSEKNIYQKLKCIKCGKYIITKYDKKVFEDNQI